MNLSSSLLFVALIRGFAQATYETPISLNVQYQDQFIAFTVQVEVENDTKGLGARWIALSWVRELAHNSTIRRPFKDKKSWQLDFAKCQGKNYLFDTYDINNSNLLSAEPIHALFQH